MTEFNASAPVGGIVVEVRLDRTPYDRALAALRSQVQRNGGAPTMTMAPSAQQLYGNAWGMGGGGRPQWTGAPGAAGGAPMGAPAAMGGAGGGGPQMAPGGGWTLNQPNAPRQPRAPRQPAQPHGNIWNSPVGFSTGGHGSIASLYGVVRIAESLMRLGEATVQTTRAMEFARSNTERIAADVQGYRAGNQALEQIPLFGPLFSTGRQFIDTMRGMSPDDIERNQAEAARIRSLYTDSSNASMQNLVRSRQAASGMFPNGNLFLDLQTNSASRKARKMALGNQIDEESQKYQFTNAESEMTGFERVATTSLAGQAANGIVGLFGGESQAYSAASARADIKNRQIDQERNKALAPLRDQNAIIDAEAKASEEKLKFASSQLKNQMQSDKLVAELTLKQQYSQADSAKRWGEFFHEISGLPEELQRTYLDRSVRTAQAERFEMATNIGRTFAAPMNPGMDVIGDPAGIRGLRDPIQGLTSYIGKLFSWGPMVMGRR